MVSGKSIIIIGCGGHALSIIDLITQNKNYEIIGLVGKNHDLGKNVLSYPVIGTDADLSSLRSKVDNAVIGIGQIKNFELRYKAYKLLKLNDFTIPNIISKTAYVSSSALVNEGSCIGNHAVINAGTSIGKGCILNSKSLIEHGCSIGDFCHISTGALINGDVKIGNNCFIGSGTIIREGLSIPSNSLISAGKCIMGWPIKQNNL